MMSILYYYSVGALLLSSEMVLEVSSCMYGMVAWTRRRRERDTTVLYTVGVRCCELLCCVWLCVVVRNAQMAYRTKSRTRKWLKRVRIAEEGPLSCHPILFAPSKFPCEVRTLRIT